MNGQHNRKIWVEVDDFIRYFDGSLTPTGVGRVQSEILPWLARLYPDRIGFCRIGRISRQVEVLSLADIVAQTDGNEVLARYDRARWLLPLLRFQRYARRRASAYLRLLSARGRTQRFVAEVRPGDVLFNMGASWTHENFGATVAELKHHYGLNFALLVHDVLPVSHPHFVTPGQIPQFAAWLGDMAQVWDLVLTPSQSTSRSLAAYLETRGTKLPPMRTIPFGAGVAGPGPRDSAQAPRRHVLYVSTIEIRKNHRLLVEVWQRLVHEHGADAVPDLVFAGKFGWEIADLRHSLKTSHFLDGKIKVVEHVPDERLGALYRASLFTVFPSFCEGWGLPVGESLSHGRYCIASNATSIPEVGGTFADYHDPADAQAAFDLIERAIFDRDFLATKEALIQRDYVNPSWTDTARAIMAAIDDMPA